MKDHLASCAAAVPAQTPGGDSKSSRCAASSSSSRISLPRVLTIDHFDDDRGAQRVLVQSLDKLTQPITSQAVGLDVGAILHTVLPPATRRRHASQRRQRRPPFQFHNRWTRMRFIVSGALPDALGCNVCETAEGQALLVGERASRSPGLDREKGRPMKRDVKLTRAASVAFTWAPSDPAR
jgi:hypothetical protein